jgi:hypothetical protein
MRLFKINWDIAITPFELDFMLSLLFSNSDGTAG